MPSVKKNKQTEPFFREMVELWFADCREKFDEDPSFTGSAPRDLKNIIQSLRKRAEKSQIPWTIETARQRLSNFLNYAWKQKWLREHWLLSNINRQKDTIFFNIRADLKRSPIDPFE